MVDIASSPVERLSVELIDESPLNPRRHWRGLEELASSLKHQQFEPILVRPNPRAAGRYELADGARRLRAAQAGAIPFLAARVVTLADDEMFAVIFGKGADGNVDPLTPMEEAWAYEQAMQQLQLTLDGLAAKFSRDRSRISRCLDLLLLPQEAKGAIERGDLPFRTAAELARIPGEELRAKTVQAVLHSDVHGGVMPFRAAKVYIDTQVCRSLSSAPFQVDDPLLLPTAGACKACRFLAGNDPAAYGDVKNPNTCMNPTCFEEKSLAARQRVIAAEVKQGKRELMPEENSTVFAPGEKGIHFKSAYVPWKQPPPRDLLKTEVGSVPAWSELCDGDVTVQVYVGVDQAGRPVDLVKLSEAFLAVPKSELAIFTEAALRRYAITKPRRADEPLAGEAKPSVKPAAKSAAKVAPDEREKSVLSAKAPAAPSRDRVWHDQAGEWIAAVLEASPTLPPKLRETGFQLLREIGASTLTQHAPVQTLARAAEWQKARRNGMSAQRIAATYEVSLEDVCGVLDLDIHEVRNEFSQLRQSVEEASAVAGLETESTRDRVSAVATGGLAFSALTTPEQLRAVLRLLSSKRKADPPPAGETNEGE